MEFTRGEHILKKRERKLNENNMYNGAWRNLIYFARDQTV
jgi:hypothetical protein